MYDTGSASKTKLNASTKMVNLRTFDMVPSLPFDRQVAQGIDCDRSRIELLCALRRPKYEARCGDLRRNVPVSELQRILGCAIDRLGRYDISERQRFVACHHPQLPVYIRAAEGELMHLDAV